jgi:succinate dehydrogenase / fumarate reductase flavoprotein subunit
METRWRQVNLISSFDGEKVTVREQALPTYPAELFDLFDIHELEKYMTPEETSKGGTK